MACFLVATLVLVPSLQVQSLGSIHTSLIMCHILLNGCHLQRVTSTCVVHKHMSKQCHLYMYLYKQNTKLYSTRVVELYGWLLPLKSGLRLPYSRKLSREKTFADFAVLWLFAKVFSAKFGGMASVVQHRWAICESLLYENHIFHQFTKVFSLESFPLYGMYVCPSIMVYNWSRTSQGHGHQFD